MSRAAAPVGGGRFRCARPRPRTTHYLPLAQVVVDGRPHGPGPSCGPGRRTATRCVACQRAVHAPVAVMVAVIQLSPLPDQAGRRVRGSRRRRSVPVRRRLTARSPAAPHLAVTAAPRFAARLAASVSAVCSSLLCLRSAHACHCACHTCAPLRHASREVRHAHPAHTAVHRDRSRPRRVTNVYADGLAAGCREACSVPSRRTPTGGSCSETPTGVVCRVQHGEQQARRCWP